MSEINEINPFINTSVTRQQEQNQKNTENNKTIADVSRLPDGVSRYNLNGTDVTLFKQGDEINMQVVGTDEFNREEILAKIMKQYI